MPEEKTLVINTGPLLSIIAAMGNLHLLGELYERVVVPFSVAKEVLAGGQAGFGIDAFREDHPARTANRQREALSMLDERCLINGIEKALQFESIRVKVATKCTV